jgi:hypothetical protein
MRASLVTMFSLASLACGPIEERRDEVVVERFSELLIVDEALLQSPLELEVRKLDFAFLMRSLYEAQAEQASQAWFDALRSASDQPDAFFRALTCPWLKSAPENACDDDCGACVSHALPLEGAPLRLIALAYRPDLALVELPGSEQGQLRFVFAMQTSEAAPEATLPMTVIFEYPLPEALSASAWAERFHALSPLRHDLSAYRRELAGLAALATRVDRPEQVTIRTRDDAFSDGRMLAWSAEAAGPKRITLENSVDLERTSTAQLEGALPEGSRHLSSLELRVPESLWADSVTRASAFPVLPDDTLAERLRLISCHGCHADGRSQQGFHIAPTAVGRARVSRFLHDPDDSQNDELSRREDALRTLLARAESKRALPHASETQSETR